jgi:hypothetical protein
MQERLHAHPRTGSFSTGYIPIRALFAHHDSCECTFIVFLRVHARQLHFNCRARASGTRGAHDCLAQPDFRLLAEWIFVGPLAGTCLRDGTVPARVGRTNAYQADVHTGRWSAWHERKEDLRAEFMQPGYRAHLLVLRVARSALYAPIASPMQSR